MAATTFDNDTSVHVRSLLALYRNLTGAVTDCRRFGSHWETIGFQGTFSGIFQISFFKEGIIILKGNT